MSNLATNPSGPEGTSHTDMCAIGLLESMPALLNEQRLQKADNNQFDFKVGEFACAAWVVDPAVGLNVTASSIEVAVADPAAEQSPVHYLYFPEDKTPYSLPQEERAIDMIGATQPLLMRRVAEKAGGSLYQVPAEATPMVTVVLDALPGHKELINQVYTNVLTELQKLATDTGALPAHLGLENICVSRVNGEPTIVPPMQFRKYKGSGLGSQVQAIAYELASDIHKKAATVGKDVDLQTFTDLT